MAQIDAYLKSTAQRSRDDFAIRIKALQSVVDMWADAIAAGDGQPHEAIAHLQAEIDQLRSDRWTT